ncbi:MAG: tRNA guanosine(34) transglycosylase Tgt [Myxococcota bacterium]
MSFVFTLEKKSGNARAGEINCSHGSIKTPIFMPVGTYGSVKATSPSDLVSLGAQIVLANTFHLHERPGEEAISDLGGLHKFMNWQRPILTDSGGFQVFSLSSLAKIDENGVEFRSPLNGAKRFFNPEIVMGIQKKLGVDIAMVFDQCPPGDSDRQTVIKAMERTTRWAERCRNFEMKEHQAVFGIVQGGIYKDLRLRHLEEIEALGFEGTAIGGLSVGEPIPKMYEVLESIGPRMAQEKPHYLMGVGKPVDIVTAIGHGIDMFDCVMPTRNARNGHLFTDDGPLIISNARHTLSERPIMESCTCQTCAEGFRRAYLRHLYKARELLYHRLASIHNLHYYLNLVSRARTAILDSDYQKFADNFITRYKAGDRKTN